MPDFVSALKRRPDDLFSNRAILVVSFLRVLRLGDDKEVADWARDILEVSGLNLLGHKGVPGAMKNPQLKAFGYDPGSLLPIIEEYKTEVNPAFEKKSSHNRKDIIAKAFKRIFNENMPIGLVFGEKGKSSRAVAIAFVHWKHNVPYDALYKLYYDLLKNPYCKLGIELIRVPSKT